MYIRIFVASLLVGAWSVVAPAQASLQRAVDVFAKDPVLRHASVSVSVVDLSTGKLVAGHRSDQSVAPASSLKVLTTSTALAVLGTDYSFTTELQYDGNIDADGVLQGNLYIKGYGDPTLGSGQMEGTPDLEGIMERFRMALQQQGIRRITGYIVGDASYFDTEVTGASWSWIDLGNYYGAGAWGLNIHENLYYLRFKQAARIGMRPDIALIDPNIQGLTFNNEVRSAKAGSGDNAYIYGGPYTFERDVRGTIPVGNGLFSIKGSMPDPPLFAAQYLDQQLRMVGIVCDRGATTQLELSRRNFPTLARQTLISHASPALSYIVQRTNLQSVNLYCEAMLRTLGAVRKQEGSAAAGIEAILEYWKEQGLDCSGAFLEDGSGLSSQNAVSSRFLAELLYKISENPEIYEVFEASLPVAGESGGLKNMFKGTPAEGRLRAKTGTLNRVRSFTGYAPGPAGRQLSFSIIANNYSCSGGVMRQKMEKLMRALCE